MRVFTFLSAKAGLPSSETTIAEVLKDTGYATALVGKKKSKLVILINLVQSCHYVFVVKSLTSLSPWSALWRPQPSPTESTSWLPVGLNSIVTEHAKRLNR